MNGFAGVLKISAKFRTKPHKFYDGDFSGADQTGRAFRWSAHLHKKAGFLRAGEAGEQARAKGVRQGVISSAIRRLSGAHVDG